MTDTLATESPPDRWDPSALGSSETTTALVHLYRGEVSRSNTWRMRLDATTNCMKTGLKRDHTVQLVGFGTWNVKTRKARWGRNPQTGNKIKIKARKTVTFKCGTDLKKYVR